MIGGTTAVGAPRSGSDLTGLVRPVATVLRAGVFVGALLLITALLALVSSGSSELTRSSPMTWGGLVDAFVHPSALGLALIGVVVLAATPLVRVVLSFRFFATHRDRPFATLTLFVLALLLATVAVGVFR